MAKYSKPALNPKAAWKARLSAAHIGPAKRPHKLTIQRSPLMPGINKVRFR